MSSGRKFIVGGNWKMNGSCDLITKMSKLFAEKVWDANTHVVIAPPYAYLDKAKAAFGATQVNIAAQNCYFQDSGAFTGEISIPMLKELGISWVIIGHSERRNVFGESDEILAKKLIKALQSGMKVIFCIGESLQVRQSGETARFIEAQLDASLKLIPQELRNAALADQLVIAYEPIWAIGTGVVASIEQAQEAHEVVRGWMNRELSPEIAASVSVLYGGSVTASNCGPLAQQKDIDGFLVGGASLKDEFLQIAKANN